MYFQRSPNKEQLNIPSPSQILPSFYFATHRKGTQLGLKELENFLEGVELTLALEGWRRSWEQVGGGRKAF